MVNMQEMSDTVKNPKEVIDNIISSVKLSNGGHDCTGFLLFGTTITADGQRGIAVLMGGNDVPTPTETVSAMSELLNLVYAPERFEVHIYKLPEGSSGFVEDVNDLEDQLVELRDVLKELAENRDREDTDS